VIISLLVDVEKEVGRLWRKSTKVVSSQFVSFPLAIVPLPLSLPPFILLHGVLLGNVKAIGVSNYNTRHLREMDLYASVVPHILQVGILTRTSERLLSVVWSDSSLVAHS